MIKYTVISDLYIILSMYIPHLLYQCMYMLFSFHTHTHILFLHTFRYTYTHTHIHTHTHSHTQTLIKAHITYTILYVFFFSFLFSKAFILDLLISFFLVVKLLLYAKCFYFTTYFISIVNGTK